MPEIHPSHRSRGRTATVALLAATIALALAKPGKATQEGHSVGVEAGRAEFLRYCASCHGVDGRGGGPVAASLRGPPPDLTSIARRHGGAFPAGAVAAEIDGRTMVGPHGSREMPVWGKLLSAEIRPETADEVTRGRIDLLIEFLRSIQRP